MAQSDRESSSGDDGKEEIVAEVDEMEKKDEPAPLVTKPTGFVFGSAAKSTVTFASLGQTAKPLFGEGNSKEEENKRDDEKSAETEPETNETVKSQGNTRS